MAGNLWSITRRVVPPATSITGWAAAGRHDAIALPTRPRLYGQIVAWPHASPSLGLL